MFKNKKMRMIAIVSASLLLAIIAVFFVHLHSIYLSKTNHLSQLVISLDSNNISRMEITSSDGNITKIARTQNSQLLDDVSDLFSGEYTYQETYKPSNQAEQPVMVAFYDSDESLIKELYHKDGLLYVNAGNGYFHGYLNSKGMLNFSAMSQS